MFQTQVQPRAAGELFLCKVMNFWTISWTFLWSLRIQTIEIIVDLLFPFLFKFYGKSYAREKNKLLHYHVISMVWTFAEQSSRPISARDVAQLL